MEVFDTVESILNALSFGGGGGASVKSIQRGTTTFNAASATVTIASVDLSRAFVVFTYGAEGLATGFSNVAQTLVSAALANATTLQFEKGASSSGNIVVNWEVVEFSSGVSVQQVTASAGSSAVNVTISTVNLSRTFLVVSNKTSSTVSNMESTLVNRARVELTSATNLSVTKTATSTGTATAVVFVVEVV